MTKKEIKTKAFKSLWISVLAAFTVSIPAHAAVLGVIKGLFDVILKTAIDNYQFIFGIVVIIGAFYWFSERGKPKAISLWIGAIVFGAAAFYMTDWQGLSSDAGIG